MSRNLTLILAKEDFEPLLPSSFAYTFRSKMGYAHSAIKAWVQIYLNISAMKRWIQSLICEQIEYFEDSDDEEEEEEFQDCVEFHEASKGTARAPKAERTDNNSDKNDETVDGSSVETPSGTSTGASTGASTGTVNTSSDRSHGGAAGEDAAKDAAKTGGGEKMKLDPGAFFSRFYYLI